jgi:hypothetical protein
MLLFTVGQWVQITSEGARGLVYELPDEDHWRIIVLMEESKDRDACTFRYADPNDLISIEPPHLSAVDEGRLSGVIRMHEQDMQEIASRPTPQLVSARHDAWDDEKDGW